MAKAILDDVLYDTWKAKRMCKYFRKFSRGGLLTPLEKWSHEVVLYRAKNGTFFEYCITTNEVQAVDEEAAKDNLKRFAPKKYMKIWPGEVKEG